MPKGEPLSINCTREPLHLGSVRSVPTMCNLTDEDWLCVVGVGSTTRVQLGIDINGGKPDFNFQSVDRQNEWGKPLPANPELTGVDIFHKLEQLSPGRYRPTQVRTLQRGLSKLRAQLLVTFDDQWGEEVVNGQISAPQLRAEIVAGVS